MSREVYPEIPFDDRRGDAIHDHERTLRCGADLDDLLEQVASGNPAPSDDHQQHCGECQRALDDLTRRWAPIAAANAPIPAPPHLATSLADFIRSARR